MTSNYPYAKLVNGEVVFFNGKFLSLPNEYTKASNKNILSDFYKNKLASNTVEMLKGTDPLGFDYVIYQNISNVGVLLGFKSNSLSNNNRKKYPSHKFDKEYFISRIVEDKKLSNFEEYIPVEIVTQNIHEIRNLNSKISSSIDAILDYATDNEWEDKFDAADENVKKIYVSSRLTKFILDNIKFYMPNYLESLKPNVERSFLIHKSVNKIVKIYSNDFKKKQSLIDFDGYSYRQINGDKELFEIVLMLLIENSIKYSRDASAICPKVKIKELNQRSVEITVHSFGSLIPDDEITKLFSRGYRSSIHKTRDGTGMGLYNASKLISLFNGTLTYQKQISSGDKTNELGWNIFVITCNDTIS